MHCYKSEGLSFQIHRRNIVQFRPRDDQWKVPLFSKNGMESKMYSMYQVKSLLQQIGITTTVNFKLIKNIKQHSDSYDMVFLFHIVSFIVEKYFTNDLPNYRCLSWPNAFFHLKATLPKHKIFTLNTNNFSLAHNIVTTPVFPFENIQSGERVLQPAK